jgi:hypothetical protein
MPESLVWKVMAKRNKKPRKPPADKGDPKQPVRLVAFFANLPLAGSEIDLERKPDYGRKIDLDEGE